MAQRRMFSKTVTDSARFLRMPGSARLLYYDLGMAADDDGCAEGFTVLRITGGREEDLCLLEEKGFLRILNEDLVVYLLDWGENNRIRRDRYHRSRYRSLVEQVLGIRLETGEGSREALPVNRGTAECPPNDSQPVTECQPVDNQTTTVCLPTGNLLPPQVRLGKVRLGKARSGKARPGQVRPGPPGQHPHRSWLQELGFSRHFLEGLSGGFQKRLEFSTQDFSGLLVRAKGFEIVSNIFGMEDLAHMAHISGGEQA